MQVSLNTLPNDSEVEPRTRPWEQRYYRKVSVTDFLIIVVVVFSAQQLRFGGGGERLYIPVTDFLAFGTNYTMVSIIICLGWLFALSVFDARDAKVIGTGPAEYQRVFYATFATFGTLAILAFIFRTEIARGYLLLALPIGLVLLLISRWLWRKRLLFQRSRGRHRYRTLVVGERLKVVHVSEQLLSDKARGFHILGAVTERGTAVDVEPGLPVVADYDNLINAVDEHDIDTLVITGSDSLTPERIRRIGWSLETRCIDLIVASSLTDIAGPRIHMRPFAGLPLIHVEYPEFVGRKYFYKRLFDMVLSALLIIVSSPIMLTVALAVKLTSRGPIFYSQERIGHNGYSFKMFKFRSMIQDADAKLQELLAEQGTSDKPLHKVENDPRITPVGHFIRKYSLDELPQLFNVLIGTMTLVGPRPQREAEVVLYEGHHYRRLMVKPGITGLWQVSGRSRLTWEEAIRLDLNYVENWSMLGDLVILFRTIKTVIKPDGAV